MFTFPLPTHELFEERRKQFVAWGIPQETVKRVEARVKDAWSDAPGGWTYEWVLEAEKAKSKEDWMLAASLFGAARFPCLATPSRIAALTQQAECFELASHAFPLHFERQVVPCDVGGRTVLIPVHIYAPKGGAQLPMVLLSGGVDTGKMELHRVCLLLSKLGKLGQELEPVARRERHRGGAYF